MTELKLKSTYITQTSSARLYGLSIPIIGLTGGIATGKSSVSTILKKKDLPLIDADKLVHTIYADSKTIQFIKSLAPACVQNNKIDFKALRSLFFSQKNIQKEIEEFIYKELPNVFKEALEKFKKPQFIIYDVPLLFEKSLDSFVDMSVTVYCDSETQIKRLIARDDIELELAKKILSKQLPIDQKRNKADYIINNNESFEKLTAQVEDFLRQVFEL